MEVVSKITEVRNSKEGGAEDVVGVDEVGVWGRVGVALGFKTEDGRVGGVGDDRNDTVGNDGFFGVSDKGDNVAGF